MTAPESNLLLDSLSPEACARILSVSKRVDLPIRYSLGEPDEPVQHAYFMLSGIASIVVELAEGGSAEVTLVGREGLAGALDLLGPALPSARCFIQIAGSGYKLALSEMKRIFLDSEEVRTRVLALVQQQSMTVNQIAACNKLHDAEARLARWLLMVQDRVQQDTLTLTQEFLAQMLGTQRTTVVMVAGAFQRSGLISYSRGKVKVHSRENLEAAACDCYKVTQRLLVNLYK